MKKRYIVFAVVGLVLGYIAKADYWFEDEREVYFPITKEQIRSYAKELHENPEFKNAMTVNHHAQDEVAFFEMLKKKLNSDYPIVSNLNHSYTREVSRRLGLLKTMQYQWPHEKSFKQLNAQDVKNYFHDVAKNEHENILVRRQAYKNWVALSSEKEERLAQLVNFSDTQMMQSLTEN